MRKLIALSLTLVLAAAFIGAAFPAGKAHAQDGGSLPMGEWVTGELTATACTVAYTIQPNAGDLVLVEMVRNTGTMDLDPAMMISDSTGAQITFADDTVAGFGAAAVFEADGNAYTITGMPSSIYFNQADSTLPIAQWDLTCPADATYGEYMIRVSVPELMVPGSTATSTIYADYTNDSSTIYVLRPEAAATWTISFAQPDGELRAGLQLLKMPDDITAIDLEDTWGVSAGAFVVNLDAGQIYFLVVSKSLYAYPFDDTLTADITVSISE